MSADEFPTIVIPEEISLLQVEELATPSAPDAAGESSSPSSVEVQAAADVRAEREERARRRARRKLDDEDRGDGDDGAVDVKLASEFVIRPVRWLWSGYIARGKIGMHDGDPGRGKSLTYVAIVAYVTTGRELPLDAKREPAGAVIVCAEDDWEDTIAPRLMAAEANLERVATVPLKRDGRGDLIPLTIPRDLGRIQRAVTRVDAAIVIFDPIMAYLGTETNAHNDASVRRALAPLKEFAELNDVAAHLVRHLNKNGDMRAEYRGGGSIGFTAQARTALVSEWHPTEEGVLVLAQLKNNLMPRMPSLSYRIESTTVEAHGVRVLVPVIRWGERVEITAEDLLRGPDGRRSTPEQDECWETMRKLFEERERWPVAEMTALLTAAGHSVSTIKRVRQKHEVQSEREVDASGRTVGWTLVKPRAPGLFVPPAS